MKSAVLLITILAAGCFSVDTQQDWRTWTPKFTAKTAEEIVASLPVGLSNVAVYATSSRFEVAGHYENGGGLSGFDLHLFCDGTYFFAYWADISPMRIHESGQWRIKSDCIILSMEKNYGPNYDMAPWREDRIYFLLNKGQDLHLMGNHFWYSLFMKDRQLEKAFDWCSFRRKTKYDRFNDANVKAQLIDDSWKPWLTDEEKQSSNHSLEPTR